MSMIPPTVRSLLIAGALLGLAAPFLAQAADKQKIYFGRLGQPDISLYISDGDGRNERLLVPHHPDGRVETVLKGTVRQPHWSPGEKQLVYERLRPRLDTDKVRVEPYESLTPKGSVDGRFTLVWGPPLAFVSPDGRWLVYHITEGETRRIGMMNANGGEVHSLFRREGMDAMNPVWSRRAICERMVPTSGS